MKSTEVRKLLPEAWGEGVMGRGGETEEEAEREREREREREEVER